MAEKNKMHKIDLIFIVGIIIIAILGALTDGLYWKDVQYGGFPVFSVTSIYASYVLLIILLVYSSLKYEEKEDKPKYVAWFMLFLLPFYHIALMIVAMIIVSILMNFLFS